MAVPKYDELMKPLLTAVKDGEVYKIKDVTAGQICTHPIHSLTKLVASPVCTIRDLPGFTGL